MIDPTTNKPRRVTLSFVDLAAGESSGSTGTPTSPKTPVPNGEALSAMRENWSELEKMLTGMGKGEDQNKYFHFLTTYSYIHRYIFKCINVVYLVCNVNDVAAEEVEQHIDD